MGTEQPAEKASARRPVMNGLAGLGVVVAGTCAFVVFADIGFMHGWSLAFHAAGPPGQSSGEDPTPLFSALFAGLGWALMAGFTALALVGAVAVAALLLHRLAARPRGSSRRDSIR